MYISIGSIDLSAATLLLPIFSYPSSRLGTTIRCSIFRLIHDASLLEVMTSEYNHSLWVIEDNVLGVWVTALCFMGISAIIPDVFGIRLSVRS